MPYDRWGTPEMARRDRLEGCFCIAVLFAVLAAICMCAALVVMVISA